jgi:hypothetical protein
MPLGFGEGKLPTKEKVVGHDAEEGWRRSVESGSGNLFG